MGYCDRLEWCNIWYPIFIFTTLFWSRIWFFVQTIMILDWKLNINLWKSIIERNFSQSMISIPNKNNLTSWPFGWTMCKIKILFVIQTIMMLDYFHWGWKLNINLWKSFVERNFFESIYIDSSWKFSMNKWFLPNWLICTYFFFQTIHSAFKSFINYNLS